MKREDVYFLSVFLAYDSMAKRTPYRLHAALRSFLDVGMRKVLDGVVTTHLHCTSPRS